MTSLAFSSIGSQVFLSAGVPATFDSVGFAALTYTEIGEVTDIATVGPESGVITHNPVASSSTYKFKSTRNNGSIDLKGARAPTDPGQILLIAAEKVNTPYSMKIVLQDLSTIYLQVLVMSYKTSIGTATQITSFEAKCEVTGDIIDV